MAVVYASAASATTFALEPLINACFTPDLRHKERVAALGALGAKAATPDETENALAASNIVSTALSMQIPGGGTPEDSDLETLWAFSQQLSKITIERAKDPASPAELDVLKGDASSGDATSLVYSMGGVSWCYLMFPQDIAPEVIEQSMGAPIEAHEYDFATTTRYVVFRSDRPDHMVAVRPTDGTFDPLLGFEQPSLLLYFPQVLTPAEDRLP
ncbi:MAG: hypothetical protein ACKO1H_08315 [Tabrizicola sp.]